MKGNTACGLALISLLFILTFSALHVQQVKAQPPPVFPVDPPVQVYMEPPTIVRALGEMFNVTIYVSSPVDLELSVWQLELQYDPAVLNFVGSTFCWTTPSSVLVNGTSGDLRAGGLPGLSGELLDVPPGLPSKVLTVTFQGFSYGISSIDFTDFALMGISDIGNGWTNGTDPYNGVPEFTQYDRWPNPSPVPDPSTGLQVIDIEDARVLSSSLYPNYYSECDFNNDSVVDRIDAAILVCDVGKMEGDPTWPSDTYPTGLTNTIYVFNQTVRNGNTVTVSIPGDINGDFAVDIYDAILLSGHYNEQVPWPHPTIDQNVNIIRDDIIDIYDALLLSNHYDESYP